MIGAKDTSVPSSSQKVTLNPSLLDRRTVLAVPAAILCTTALDAATPEQRPLALSLADAAQLRPHNVSVTPTVFRERPCVEVRIAIPYPGPDRDFFAYVPGLDM